MPNTYLLTWTCYGTWLHGDARGSVDYEHNIIGDPFLEPDADHLHDSREKMTQPPFLLDEPQRIITLNAIVQLSTRKGWTLHAVHVRSNHVHVVIGADRDPKRLMSDLKAAASKALNLAGYDSTERKRWTRGGSRKWINDDAYFNNAIGYVRDGQGEPMQRWPDKQ